MTRKRERQDREIRKKPYQPPKILSREKLEVIAAVCSPGKALGQGGDCLVTVSS